MKMIPQDRAREAAYGSGAATYRGGRCHEDLRTRLIPPAISKPASPPAVRAAGLTNLSFVRR